MLHFGTISQSSKSRFCTNSTYTFISNTNGMNLFSTSVVAIVLMASASTVQAEECWIGDDDFFPLVIAEERDRGFAGMVQPTSRTMRNGQKLILSSDQECDIGWRLETSGAAKLFHTSEDPSLCLQAGRRGEDIDALISGTKMRIYPCDEGNDLQRFIWGNGGCNGAIKPEGRDDLCMTWRGVVANLDSDPIILVECDKLDKKRAAGWWPA
jgi:hypothetical protein